MPLPIKGDDRLSAQDRLNIYANMYFFRILDSLKEDFPSILEKLGDDGFHNLITDYLVAHPPTHYSLRYAGQHLAEFLDHRYSDLADLARFEWAQLEAFDAADAVLLTESDLKKIPPNHWPVLRLNLHPSVQLLAHDHHVVWRQELTVVHRVADDVEWGLLSQIHSGTEFAVLCEGTPPEAILNYLRTWISQGLLAK